MPFRALPNKIIAIAIPMTTMPPMYEVMISLSQEPPPAKARSKSAANNQNKTAFAQSPEQMDRSEC
jgi:hypothetical protein